jgi:hypothetical protein
MVAINAPHPFVLLSRQTSLSSSHRIGAREGAGSERRCGRERVARGMQRRRRVRGRGDAGSSEGERGGGGAGAAAASWSKRGGGALRVEGAGDRGVAASQRAARGGMEVGAVSRRRGVGEGDRGVAGGHWCRGGMEVGDGVATRVGWSRAAAGRRGRDGEEEGCGGVGRRSSTGLISGG